MPKAIRIHETGGPEVLRWEEVTVPKPGPGEVRLRQTAIGLNYVDVYHRSGLYPLPGLPAVLGMEAAGVVEEVGEGVTEIKTGQRVAYASAPVGAYAEERVMPASRLVKLPGSIGNKTAAALMLKGLTAWFLLRRTFPVGPGHTVLVHAAAGGVGQILCHWACKLGATVIGTVGNQKKADIVGKCGCSHPIVYTDDDFVAKVKEITDGDGVDVVYDGVGAATFEKSLDCLKPMGMMVSFGNASGPVPAIDPLTLTAKGSIFLTRPSLMHYTASDADYKAGAGELCEFVLGAHTKFSPAREYLLSEAAEAHRALESRVTAGSVVLLTGHGE